MQCNVGGADRWARIVFGILIIGAGFMYGSWWGLVGLVLLVTGVFRTCCLYKPFGISTCKTELKSEAPAMSQQPTESAPQESQRGNE